MAQAVIHTLAPVMAGDTWRGIQSARLTSDGTIFDADLSRVSMAFADESGETVLRMASDGLNPGITIDNANEWRFTVAEIARFPLAAGDYTWAISFYDAENIRRTYVAGSITVLQNPNVGDEA